MSVNEKLKFFVERNGIKQSFIVSQTGFSKNKVSQTLNGKRTISAEELEIFCNALNITPNDIYYIN